MEYKFNKRDFGGEYMSNDCPVGRLVGRKFGGNLAVLRTAVYIYSGNTCSKKLILSNLRVNGRLKDGGHAFLPEQYHRINRMIKQGTYKSASIEIIETI